MESLLDMLRKDKVKIGGEVTDCLLGALDTLKALKDELASGRECSVDVAPAVTRLKKAIAKASAPGRRSVAGNRALSRESGPHAVSEETGGSDQAMLPEAAHGSAPGDGGNRQANPALPRHDDRIASQSRAR